MKRRQTGLLIIFAAIWLTPWAALSLPGPFGVSAFFTGAAAFFYGMIVAITGTFHPDEDGDDE